MATEMVVWVCEVCRHENDPINLECSKTDTHPVPVGAIIRVRQTVPAEFADTLWSLKGDRNRLDATLIAARNLGWTLDALASPLGLTRERIRQRAARGCVIADVPEIPHPPTRQPPAPEPPRRRLIPRGEVVARLREMQTIARKVNGGTAADHPSRTVSVEFAALLHSLVEQGVTLLALAEVLGVNRNSIQTRLSRHGHRQPSPSVVHDVYVGRPVQPKEHCLRGHPFSGDNLYVAANGRRFCKACDSIRHKAHYQRKHAKAGA